MGNLLRAASKECSVIMSRFLPLFLPHQFLASSTYQKRPDINYSHTIYVHQVTTLNTRGDEYCILLPPRSQPKYLSQCPGEELPSRFIPTPDMLLKRATTTDPVTCIEDDADTTLDDMYTTL